MICVHVYESVMCNVLYRRYRATLRKNDQRKKVHPHQQQGVIKKLSCPRSFAPLLS